MNSLIVYNDTNSYNQLKVLRYIEADANVSVVRNINFNN